MKRCLICGGRWIQHGSGVGVVHSASCASVEERMRLNRQLAVRAFAALRAAADLHGLLAELAAERRELRKQMGPVGYWEGDETEGWGERDGSGGWGD
jgi:hypothetical protein